MKNFPFIIKNRQVPLKMSEVYRSIKDLLAEVCERYAQTGYEFLIEMKETEPAPKTSFYIKISSKQGKGNSQLDTISDYLDSHPRAVTSCGKKPGGTQMSFERATRDGKLHRGTVRVIFSGYSMEALDQETSVRILHYATSLIQRTADDYYSFDDIPLLMDPFCAYILYHLGFESEAYNDYDECLGIDIYDEEE